MTAPELLAPRLLTKLRSRGVRLIPDRGRVIVDAPRGAVSAAERAALVASKPALLALLVYESSGPGPRPMPWRRRLSDWPVAWRERWGRRAVELEDEGLDWRTAEQRAFVETNAMMAQISAADDAYAIAERIAIRDEPRDDSPDSRGETCTDPDAPEDGWDWQRS